MRSTLQRGARRKLLARFRRHCSVTPDDSVVFVLGRDYHLGDLLWLTAVIKWYRRQRSPARVRISIPDSPIGRILEHCEVVDEIEYRSPRVAPVVRAGERLHDLRIVPLGWAMIREWRRCLPWRYYRDLWLEPRGQWLATFLGLGRLPACRPVLALTEEDAEPAKDLPQPYIVLAPHIGAYSFPLTGIFWRKVKGWENDRWVELAVRLRDRGLTPVTVAAAGQPAIEGTVGLLGLPIRHAAAVIAGARGMVSSESGLWFVAAATDVPFVIVPWWLPRSVDWPGAMRASARLVRRPDATVRAVLDALESLSVATLGVGAVS